MSWQQNGAWKIKFFCWDHVGIIWGLTHLATLSVVTPGGHGSPAVGSWPVRSAAVVSSLDSCTSLSFDARVASPSRCDLQGAAPPSPSKPGVTWARKRHWPCVVTEALLGIVGKLNISSAHEPFHVSAWGCDINHQRDGVDETFEGFFGLWTEAMLGFDPRYKQSLSFQLPGILYQRSCKLLHNSSIATDHDRPVFITRNQYELFSRINTLNCQPPLHFSVLTIVKY